MVEVTCTLQKSFNVVMPYTLLLTWDWGNCYQDIFFPKIVLDLNMSKINWSQALEVLN